MLLLIRIFLVSLIIYLIIRAFSRYLSMDAGTGQDTVHDKKKDSRKISKETGEYIDFEEQDK